MYILVQWYSIFALQSIPIIYTGPYIIAQVDSNIINTSQNKDTEIVKKAWRQDSTKSTHSSRLKPASEITVL